MSGSTARAHVGTGGIHWLTRKVPAQGGNPINAPFTLEVRKIPIERFPGPIIVGIIAGPELRPGPPA
jgi:hypothetical protein